MSNMFLEDMLDLLAEHGTVTVSRVDYAFAASPHLVGKPKAWKVRVDVEGTMLDRSWIKAYFDGEATSAKDAANSVVTQLENYLSGDAVKADRERYAASRGAKHEAWCRARVATTATGGAGQ